MVACHSFLDPSWRAARLVITMVAVVVYSLMVPLAHQATSAAAVSQQAGAEVLIVDGTCEEIALDQELGAAYATPGAASNDAPQPLIFELHLSTSLPELQSSPHVITVIDEDQLEIGCGPVPAETSGGRAVVPLQATGTDTLVGVAVLRADSDHGSRLAAYVFPDANTTSLDETEADTPDDGEGEPPVEDGVNDDDTEGGV